MAATITRVAAGTPTGGQFAAHDRPDADIELIVARTPVDEALDVGTGVARLAELADDDNWLVSRHIARHPNATAAILAVTAKSDDSAVRAYTAANPAIDLDTQTALVRDRVSDVRVHLADNPNLHASVQRELAHGRDVHAQIRLAQHPNLNRGARQLMEDGPFPKVKEILRNRPKQY